MVDLAVLRILAEVAMHPSHRLPWISKMSGRSVESYPPRRVFEHTLMENMKKMDANVSTISSLLLTAFREDKFKQNREDIVTTFNSVNKWWEANTTARYEDEKDSILEAEQGQRNNIVEGKTVDLKDILRRAQARAREDAMLTSMETMPYCAPHECVLALSLFSRLALEPKFKKLFLDRDSTSTLISLLACVGVGIWAEAREAAATLANLMWMPDQEEERLVCWLKFDGAKCIALDASNVLLPVKAGNPLPVAIGKGMYKSCWGIEFVENSCVTLHPDGLKTHKVPGSQTSGCLRMVMSHSQNISPFRAGITNLCLSRPRQIRSLFKVGRQIISLKYTLISRATKAKRHNAASGGLQMPRKLSFACRRQG